MHAHTHSHTHALTHMRAHTYTCSHTHTHSYQLGGLWRLEMEVKQQTLPVPCLVALVNPRPRPRSPEHLLYWERQLVFRKNSPYGIHSRFWGCCCFVGVFFFSFFFLCVCAVGTDLLFYFDCYYRNKMLTVVVLSERSLKIGRCLIFC